MRFSQLKQLAGGTWQKFNEHRAEILAAGIAYYTLISLAPLLLLSVVVAGLVFGEQQSLERVLTQVDTVVGPEAKDIVHQMIDSARAQRENSLSVIVGAVIVLFGASRVFAQLQEALNAVWGISVDDGTVFSKRGMAIFARRRMMAFAMVLLVGALLLMSMVARAVLVGVQTFAQSFLPQIGWLWKMADFAGSVALSSGLFAVLYWALPDVKVPRHSAWAAGVFSGTLVTVGTMLLSVYLGSFGVGSLSGAAGSVIAILLWVYICAYVFFFGAELGSELSRLLGDSVETQVS